MPTDIAAAFAAIYGGYLDATEGTVTQARQANLGRERDYYRLPVEYGAVGASGQAIQQRAFAQTAARMEAAQVAAVTADEFRKLMGIVDLARGESKYSEENLILKEFIKYHGYEGKFAPEDLYISFEKLDDPHWEFTHEGVEMYIYAL